MTATSPPPEVDTTRRRRHHTAAEPHYRHSFETNHKQLLLISFMSGLGFLMFSVDIGRGNRRGPALHITGVLMAFSTSHGSLHCTLIPECSFLCPYISSLLLEAQVVTTECGRHPVRCAIAVAHEPGPHLVSYTALTLLDTPFSSSSIAFSCPTCVLYTSLGRLSTVTISGGLSGGHDQ